jgi:hypothetical protein
MVSNFVREMSADLDLTAREAAILAAVDVRTHDDLDSLVRAYPSISALGVRLPVLSNAASRHLSARYSAAVYGSSAASNRQASTEHGAIHPQNAPCAPGAHAPVPAGLPPTGSPPSTRSSIDLRCPNWSIRDQGARGTCVAFAAAAAIEQHAHSQSAAPPTDMSEQFLHWSIKTSPSDPWPNQDGATLDLARDALGRHGICPEADWPYNPVMVPASFGQGPPSSWAMASAQLHVRAAREYREFKPNEKGAAGLVWSRPLCVAAGAHCCDVAAHIQG